MIKVENKNILKVEENNDTKQNMNYQGEKTTFYLSEKANEIENLNEDNVPERKRRRQNYLDLSNKSISMMRDNSELNEYGYDGIFNLFIFFLTFFVIFYFFFYIYFKSQRLIEIKQIKVLINKISQ